MTRVERLKNKLRKIENMKTVLGQRNALDRLDWYDLGFARGFYGNRAQIAKVEGNREEEERLAVMVLIVRVIQGFQKLAEKEN